MPTNRAPFEYEYLSARLLTNLVQQDEASRPRRKRWVGLNLGWLSYSERRRGPSRHPDCRSKTSLRFRTRLQSVPSQTQRRPRRSGR